MKHKQELAGFLARKIEKYDNYSEILTWLVEFEELKEEDTAQ